MAVNFNISEDEETGIQHVYDTCCDPGFYQKIPLNGIISEDEEATPQEEIWGVDGGPGPN